MRHTLCHILLAALCAALFAGCAAYPVVQVAGGAMTGYDAAILADEYLPRDSVEGGSLKVKNDRMMQRRLRERLRINNLQTVSGHVIMGQAFLVGEVPDRASADYAIQTAATVQGIKSIRCKFFPMAGKSATRKDGKLTDELKSMYGKSKALRNADMRVEVVQGHAVLIGLTDNGIQRARAVAMAYEVGELTAITDYIVVRSEVAAKATAPQAQ